MKMRTSYESLLLCRMMSNLKFFVFFHENNEYFKTFYSWSIESTNEGIRISLLISSFLLQMIDMKGFYKEQKISIIPVYFDECLGDFSKGGVTTLYF